MLSKKIKWYLLFENKSSLDEQFSLRNTCVYANYVGEFLLVKEGAEYHAFKNRCPHQNKPMEGCKTSEGHVICPHHKYSFSCKDGKGHGLYLEKHEIKFESEKVFIGIEKWSLF